MKHTLHEERDCTLDELRRLFAKAGLEFYIKEVTECIAKVHFMVKPDDK
tara:strand:+ start:155 stop:301 length:147 start_codon:yes stop_codon:yes gene_type:complete